jgi:elongation factor P
MIQATELKNGVTFLSYNKPYKVIKYSLIKMGRGGAVVKVTARNLETGGIEDKTYSSNIKVEDITTEKRKLQFLYSDDSGCLFIDPKTYEQISIPKKVLQADLDYIKEGEEVDVLFWEDRPLSVEIPVNVILKVVDTPPGVKGNSASNVYKDAKLENGLSVKVPLFIKIGEKVKVDTRTGQYLERAK